MLAAALEGEAVPNAESAVVGSSVDSAHLGRLLHHPLHPSSTVAASGEDASAAAGAGFAGPVSVERVETSGHGWRLTESKEA